MSLSSEYKQQFGWRPWPAILNALPSLQGQVVLDFGCAVGDQAAEFVARGARVIGVDIDGKLIAEARARGLENAEFRQLDLRTLPALGVIADGLWCSFGAAYFPDLSPVLAAWSRNLRPGGWMALTEIDNLFGHEPLESRSRDVLDQYARKALASGWYDFHMGHKLRACMERAGLQVTRVLMPVDQELSFDGPAPPDVIEAWRKRFERITLLRQDCGNEFETVRNAFLRCLSRPDHQSLAKVYCCIATKRRTAAASGIDKPPIAVSPNREAPEPGRLRGPDL